MGSSKLNKSSKTGFFRKLFKRKSARKRSAVLVVDDQSKTEDKPSVRLDQKSRKTKKSFRSTEEQPPPSANAPCSKSVSKSLTQNAVDKYDKSPQHSPKKTFLHEDNDMEKKVEAPSETDECQVGSTKFVKVNAPKRPAITKLRQHKPKTPKTPAPVVSSNQKLCEQLPDESKVLEKTDQVDKSKNKSAEVIDRSAFGPAELVAGERLHICSESMKEIRTLRDQVYALGVRLTKQENDLQCQAQELAALKSRLRIAHHILLSDSDDATSGTLTLNKKTVIQSKIPVLSSIATKSSPAAAENRKNGETPKMALLREGVQQQMPAQKTPIALDQKSSITPSRIPTIKPAPISSTRLY